MSVTQPLHADIGQALAAFFKALSELFSSEKPKISDPRGRRAALDAFFKKPEIAAKVQGQYNKIKQTFTEQGIELMPLEKFRELITEFTYVTGTKYDSAVEKHEAVKEITGQLIEALRTSKSASQNPTRIEIIAAMGEAKLLENLDPAIKTELIRNAQAADMSELFESRFPDVMTDRPEFATGSGVDASRFGASAPSTTPLAEQELYRSEFFE